MKVVRALALATLWGAASTFAAAQTAFPNYVPMFNTGILYRNAFGSGAPQSSDYILAFRNTAVENEDVTAPYAFLPITAFASASQVAAVGSQFSQELASFRTQIKSQADETRSKLANGIALAGAMDMIRPAAGAQNRLGGQVSDFDGRAAVAFNYMHQQGAFDVGITGGFADGAAMGKVGAGISW